MTTMLANSAGPWPLPPWTAVMLLVLACLAAVQARAIRGAHRPLIQQLCRRRGRPERYQEIITSSETVAFIAATAVVVAAVAATLVAFAGPAGRPVPGGLAAAAAWVVLVWALLVVVPNLLVHRAGPWIVVATWTLWRPAVRLIAPGVALLARGGAALAAAFGRRSPAVERPHEALELVVEEAHQAGRLEGEARDMIRGVIGLDEVRVSAVMTPRTDIVAIPGSAPWEEAVRIAAESGHTRLPVWGRSPDDVVGILHTRDALRVLAQGLDADAAPPDLRQLLRPPWFVPESMSVGKLLREFQRGDTHLAVATDEFGGVSGLVTIEDVLEEIVGEIADEHDEAFTDGIRMLSETACEALAHVRIEAVNRRLGVALPEEADYETIGGLVFHQCGRVPEVGARTALDGVRLEVLAVNGRRIELVRVERPASEEDAGGRRGGA
jgi:CBS domain containing-hemolysin-like protein